MTFHLMTRPFLGVALAASASWIVVDRAQADELFVTNATSGVGSIGAYSTSGATINASLVTGLNAPQGIAVSSGDLFVANYNTGTIGEYNATTGTTIAPSLIGGLSLSDSNSIAVSGGDIFETNSQTVFNGNIDGVSSFSFNYWVGEYTTSGALVNGAVVTLPASPAAIAVSGGDLFVATGSLPNSVGEYTTAGAIVNASLISNVDFPGGIAVSGGHVFVTSFTLGTIGEYDATTGAAINPVLVTGLDFPTGIAVSGNNLFVVNHNGTIGEYTTSGVAVNASLIMFVDSPFGIAVAADTAVPEPSSLVSFALGAVGMLLAARHRRNGQSM